MCTGRCVQFHAHQAHSKGSDSRLQAGQAGNQAEEPTVRLDSNPIVYGPNHIGLESFGCNVQWMFSRWAMQSRYIQIQMQCFSWDLVWACRYFFYVLISFQFLLVWLIPFAHGVMRCGKGLGQLNDTVLSPSRTVLFRGPTDFPFNGWTKNEETWCFRRFDVMCDAGCSTELSWIIIILAFELGWQAVKRKIVREMYEQHPDYAGSTLDKLDPREKNARKNVQACLPNTVTFHASGIWKSLPTMSEFLEDSFCVNKKPCIYIYIYILKLYKYDI